MVKLARDLHLAVIFLTRIPLPPLANLDPGAMTRALRLFPLVGAAIGAGIGLLYWGLSHLGVPATPAAWIAIAGGLAITGVLHEDGLADTSDGFGGGRDREAKLAILRDSRIGAYGAAALVVALGLKAALLAGFDGRSAVAFLALSEGASRAAMPWMMRLLPPARRDGVAASLDPIGLAILIPASATAAVLILWLAPWKAWLLVTVFIVAIGFMCALAKRQIGGFTGDILGATQQLAMLAMLTVLAIPA
ncbi:adenosylcobinamide-GDP ribazoletransferase [Lacibacterium aquatile]|uniref:Adenosylcobinamide-GDP ribazoletransferase n=1 Tax=Lacibacterium aquatile TaxID=1168082 RepID=A0ABW5DZH5_9PROT